jgi:hypothetical protein
MCLPGRHAVLFTFPVRVCHTERPWGSVAGWKGVREYLVDLALVDLYVSRLDVSVPRVAFIIITRSFHASLHLADEEAGFSNALAIRLAAIYARSRLNTSNRPNHSDDGVRQRAEKGLHEARRFHWRAVSF